MEGPKKNKFEDFTAEEQQKLVWMQMQIETIKDYILRTKISMAWIFELDDLLNESYDDFLPEQNTEKLRETCIDFSEMLNAGEQRLVFSTSEYLTHIVDSGYVLTKGQIIECQSLINRIKEKIIPRLKRKGWKDAVLPLENMIIQLEIKIANDDD